MTHKGREVVEIAQGLVPEAEQHVAETIGAKRLEALHRDLRAIRAATWEKYRDELTGDGSRRDGDWPGSSAS